MLNRLAERARRAVELTPFPQPPLEATRYPVVLMHGFGTLAGLFGLGILHAHAMHLRGYGIRAYAPNVNPYDTVEVRTRAWQNRIDLVLEETGADRVSLVAFSAGGLDARHLIGPLGYADRVAAVVTVSTPHHGTALCDFLLERPERLRAFVIGVMDFVGRAAYTYDEPRTGHALHELTPAFVCEQFNPHHPDVEGVYAASWGGRAGKGTDVPLSPALLLHNRILYAAAGINDGMVPVESARWGDVRGVLDADHLRQVGAGLPGGAFDSLAFVLDLVRDLAARGF
jgi:triacylglycerol lipase